MSADLVQTRTSCGVTGCRPRPSISGGYKAEIWRHVVFGLPGMSRYWGRSPLQALKLRRPGGRISRRGLDSWASTMHQALPASAGVPADPDLEAPPSRRTSDFHSRPSSFRGECAVPLQRADRRSRSGRPALDQGSGYGGAGRTSGSREAEIEIGRRPPTGVCRGRRKAKLDQRRLDRLKNFGRSLVSPECPDTTTDTTIVAIVHASPNGDLLMKQWMGASENSWTESYCILIRD